VGSSPAPRVIPYNIHGQNLQVAVKFVVKGNFCLKGFPRILTVYWHFAKTDRISNPFILLLWAWYCIKQNAQDSQSQCPKWWVTVGLPSSICQTLIVHSLTPDVHSLTPDEIKIIAGCSCGMQEAQLSYIAKLQLSLCIPSSTLFLVCRRNQKDILHAYANA